MPIDYTRLILEILWSGKRNQDRTIKFYFISSDSKNNNYINRNNKKWDMNMLTYSIDNSTWYLSYTWDIKTVNNHWKWLKEINSNTLDKITTDKIYLGSLNYFLVINGDFTKRSILFHPQTEFLIHFSKNMLQQNFKSLTNISWIVKY